MAMAKSDRQRQGGYLHRRLTINRLFSRIDAVNRRRILVMVTCQQDKMRRSGELVQWNNKGGYGFVRDDAGRDYYVHISKVAGDSRPHIGDHLSFEAAAGRKGRPSAIDVTIIASAPTPQATLHDVKQPAPGVSRYKLGLRTAAATLMTLLILWAIGTVELFGLAEALTAWGRSRLSCKGTR
jgi:cold shock CspA family protein